MPSSPSSTSSPIPPALPHVAARTGYAAILTTPGVPFVFASALSGRFAYAVVGLPMLIAVESATGSYAVAGAAMGAYGATAGFLAPLRARLIDRFGRRRMLLALAIAFSVALGLLALETAVGDSASWSIALAGVVGVVAPPLGPIMRVLWAALVPSPGLLRKALSLDAVLEEVLYLAGPVLAGAILLWLSPSAALLIPAALIVVGTVLMVSSPAMLLGPARPAANGSPRSEPLLTDPRFVALLLPVLAAGVLVGTVYVAVPALIGATGQVGTSGNAGSTAEAGIVLAVFAAGSAVGGLVYGALRIVSSATRQLLVIAGLFVVGIAAAGLATSTPVLGLLIALAGLCLSPIMIVAYVAASAFGRGGRDTEATTWVNTAHNVGAAAGSALAGVLIEARGAEDAFFGAAIGGAALLVLAGITRWVAPPA
ncbi:MFS transporter [Cryobacterium algoritolerans]|uniref:MFS transporter n=1 Tax=Cryobacterium algoritolerans TaxID=1259184 RepID=A0A4R8WU62_9MICO|nr:MFS transporter [Cryobacterium algoritolerans]TFC15247.1 MFS transporter [Cryobacterium algoritolerans]